MINWFRGVFTIPSENPLIEARAGACSQRDSDEIPCSITALGVGETTRIATRGDSPRETLVKIRARLVLRPYSLNRSPGESVVIANILSTTVYPVIPSGPGTISDPPMWS